MRSTNIRRRIENKRIICDITLDRPRNKCDSLSMENEANKMKLSDTKNPKTGEPFTMAQIQKGAGHVGLSWAKDRSENPELSDALSAAAKELGWSNPTKTLERAVAIESKADQEKELAKLSEKQIRWYDSSVWINGAHSNLSRETTVSVLRAEGIEIEGDGFHGSVKTVSNKVLVRIQGATKKALDEMQAAYYAPKTTQVWDDNGPRHF